MMEDVERREESSLNIGIVVKRRCRYAGTMFAMLFKREEQNNE